VSDEIIECSEIIQIVLIVLVYLLFQSRAGQL